MFNAAVVYATIDTVDSDAIIFAINSSAAFSELLVIDTECGSGEFLTAFLSAIGVTSAKFSQTTLYKRTYPYLPRGVQRIMPVSHKFRKGRLGEVSFDSAVTALKSFGDVFTIGELIAATATALDEIVNNEDYLNGGYNACAAVFGGWYDVVTAYSDFTDLLNAG